MDVAITTKNNSDNIDSQWYSSARHQRNTKARILIAHKPFVAANSSLHMPSPRSSMHCVPHPKLLPPRRLDLFPANGLGLLALVEAIHGLQLLDQLDVALLGLLGGDGLVDDLLPRALLRLALEVEDARGLGLLDRGVLRRLLVEGVHFLGGVG